MQRVLAHIAALHLMNGHVDDAKTVITRAHAVEHDDPGGGHAETLFGAALVSWSRGRHDVARAQAASAIDRMSPLVEAGTVSQSDLDEVQDWLAQHLKP